MPSIELVDTFADDSLEMAEDGHTFRVAQALQDKIAANDATANAHAARHADGGPDELSVTGLSGKLADAQTPLAHKASHQDGGADELVVTGLSGKLADAQTALAHASTHAPGGADAIATGVPVALTVGGVAAAGGAATLANSAHVHGMPGVASAGAAGFMAAADKTKLDGIVFGSVAGTYCEGNDARLTAALVNPAVNGFRLSTSNTDPLSGNGTFSTLYLTPYNSNVIALYTGGFWKLFAIAGASLPLSGLIANRPADVFAYDNAGVVTLELLNWSATPNTRATALVRQDGVWVKSGDATRRYIGTILGSTGTTIVQGSFRCAVWNASNRVALHFGELFPNTTNITTASVYQQIGATVEYVAGLSDEWLTASALAVCKPETGSAALALGFDTTIPVGFTQNVFMSLTNVFLGVAANTQHQAIGFHRIAAYVFSTNTATQFIGYGNGANSGGYEVHHRY